MKLATCEVKGQKGRKFVAAALSGDLLVDLKAAHAALRDKLPASIRELTMPTTMLEFLEAGPPAMNAAYAIVEATNDKSAADRERRGTTGEQLFYRTNEVYLHAPVPRPGKIIHTSCNFDAHITELATKFKDPLWQSHSWDKFHFQHPTGFLEAPSSVVGTDASVAIPRFTKQLDYEIEIAIVIGRRGKYVGRDEALGYIAGFTVFNDLSARDIQAREHANRVILLGKSFDGSCPFGPYLVTKDEFKDVRAIKMELCVNGESRQKASTGEMHYGIIELVSWWSNITLEPGDIITSGSPPGAAGGRGNYLKPDDVVEATIEGIGTLRTVIAAEERAAVDAERVAAK